MLDNPFYSKEIWFLSFSCLSDWLIFVCLNLKARLI